MPGLHRPLVYDARRVCALRICEIPDAGIAPPNARLGVVGLRRVSLRQIQPGAQLKGRVPLAWSCRTFLESPHILSEVGDAGFRSFRLVPVHGLQKGRPNRHVTLALGSLAGAGMQDLGDMVGRVNPVVPHCEQSQPGGRHRAVVSGGAKTLAVVAMAPGAILPIHFLPGIGIRMNGEIAESDRIRSAIPKRRSMAAEGCQAD